MDGSGIRGILPDPGRSRAPRLGLAGLAGLSAGVLDPRSGLALWLRLSVGFRLAGFHSLGFWNWIWVGSGSLWLDFGWIRFDFGQIWLDFNWIRFDFDWILVPEFLLNFQDLFSKSL